MMLIRRISAIALSTRDFPSFAEKIAEACTWIEIAARQGSQLAVLPEMINMYCGDGPDNPNALPIEAWALDDWQDACAQLIDYAVQRRIALILPVMIRERNQLRNCFYLLDAEGKVRGRYIKTYPTLGELQSGVCPGGEQPLLDWDGIAVGGGICFDMNFPDLFTRQAAAGAQLFLCPSLSPGGDAVQHYARSLSRSFVVAYPAWSRIIDVLGRPIIEGGYRHETLRFGGGVPVYTADINFDRMVVHLDGHQRKIAEILRCYGDRVHVEFDQQNLVFAVTACSDDLTIAEIQTTFALEPVQEYLAAARRQVESAAKKGAAV